VKISIIVPAFNEEKLIGETLRRITVATGAFAECGWGSELIVCDNNSTDRTAEVAREAGAQVVFEPVNQIARARNTGAGAATGDWLLFIDADSHPQPELFADVAAAIQCGGCLAGGSTVRLDVSKLGTRLGIRFWNFISRTTRSVAGSFVFCETAAFRQLGGFSLQLFATEELEIGKRLRKLAKESGKRIIILHRHPLVTSARKFDLYSGREYARFFLRTVFGFGSTLKSAHECHIWYDGRR